MAMTLAELRALTDGEGLRYFLDPGKPRLVLGVTGFATTFQFAISLMDEGRFLQFRTIGLQHCPADHRHAEAVLAVLSAVNYQLRFVKFAWDISDGEVVAYGDIWLMDGTLSRPQFQRVLSNFIPAIDMSHPRIERTMQSGEDPGPIDPQRIAKEAEERKAGGGFLKKWRDKIGGRPITEI